MSRKANLIPSKQLNVALPLPTFTQLSLELFSDLEQRVPHGAFSAFLTDRIREYFAHQHLDLAPFIGSESGALIVSGTPEAIQALRSAL